MTDSLNISLSVCLNACLPVYLNTCLLACLSGYLSVCLITNSVKSSISLSAYLPVYLHFILNSCLSVSRSVCLSVQLPIAPRYYPERKFRKLFAYRSTQSLTVVNNMLTCPRSPSGLFVATAEQEFTSATRENPGCVQQNQVVWAMRQGEGSWVGSVGFCVSVC